jgi:NADH-quinone oxidoreductase subunit L
LPTTYWTFLFGCLALAGVCPFAGFFSKDAILVEVYERAEAAAADPLMSWLLAAAMASVFLTAFYTFRAFFVTFHGPELIPREAERHGHLPSRAMTVPLMILAICSLLVGAYFHWTGGFARFLLATPSLASLAAPPGEEAAASAAHLTVALSSSVLGLVGIGLAAVVYLAPRRRAERLAAALDGLYRLSHDKFYIDEIYQGLVVWPVAAFARLCYRIDQGVIDGLVNLCGLVPRLMGAALRPLQNGLVQSYALGMLLGLLALLGLLLLG